MPIVHQDPRSLPGPSGLPQAQCSSTWPKGPWYHKIQAECALPLQEAGTPNPRAHPGWLQPPLFFQAPQ